MSKREGKRRGRPKSKPVQVDPQPTPIAPLTRQQAAALAAQQPVPPFRYGEVWSRRGKSYTILCSRLLAEHEDRFTTRAGKVKMCRVRSGPTTIVKLVGSYGEVFETAASTFFNDPRWPAVRVGTDPDRAALVAKRIAALADSRIAAPEAAKEEE